MARTAEIKFTGFLAEHHLPLAAADHLGHLILTSFLDSKIIQGYSNALTNVSCIFNRSIKPDLHANLTNELRILVWLQMEVMTKAWKK